MYEHMHTCLLCYVMSFQNLFYLYKAFVPPQLVTDQRAYAYIFRCYTYCRNS